MSESAFLSAADIARITRKKRWCAQCRVLAAKGIRFTRAGINSDGEPLVRCADVDAHGNPAQRHGHRWDRLAGVKQIRP